MCGKRLARSRLLGAVRSWHGNGWQPHPGKYNCGGHLPRHADAPAVRDKMRALDPKGMFARPAFDASVLSRGLSAPPCCFALPQRCFTTCF